MKRLITALLAFLIFTSCSMTTPVPAPPTTAPVTQTSSSSETDTTTALSPLETFTPIPSFTPAPTESPTNTPVPLVESLKATVTADLLSCRYGPGAEYLYLYGLRKGANIKLIGQTGGNNWVWVDGKNKCWVNTMFIEITGDKNSLPVVYPGIAKLPVSPYYRPTTVLHVTRDKKTNIVTVNWLEVPINPGDYEDANMFNYIVEVWRCENGQIIFDPLPTNDASITFIDEPGCTAPSHGRVFVQEKHGFAGPSEIPWPAQ